MLDLGPHATYIVIAYAITAVVTTALIIWVVLDEHRQQKLLGALEAQGIKRRSEINKN